MKRTPGGESKVPEIVGREALRDEVLFLFFFYEMNEIEATNSQLSCRHLSVMQIGLTIYTRRYVLSWGQL